MPRVWPCGCTYRDTGSTSFTDPRLEPAARTMLELVPVGMTWSALCIALNMNTHEKRDALHRVMHEIATPEVTPMAGRGRRGTRWHLVTG
jgi:hypothetical protein